MVAVSVVLPTYNRAKFLPEAIQSILAQDFDDWELIIVDDGSTDETADLIPKLTAGIQQPIQYIRQENKGAYAARNTGVDHATGEYIAFYDSDDIWLPHHLLNCTRSLDANSDIDWIYGASRLVDFESGQVISESSFYDNGNRRPFLDLPCERRGEVAVIDGRSLLSAVIRKTPLFAGLQNSVISTNVLQRHRFRSDIRNGGDKLLVLRCVADRCKFAYLDEVHVIYRIHRQNSSLASTEIDPAASARVIESIIRQYEEFDREVKLSTKERRELRRKIGNLYFWHLGYSTQWNGGNRFAAIRSFIHAIAQYPWVPAYWKTLVVCLIRWGLGIGRRNDHVV